MDNDSIELRIQRSQVILAGWLALGRPSGNLEDIMGMVWQEVGMLDAMALTSSPHARDAADLARRYREFAANLKGMAH